LVYLVTVGDRTRATTAEKVLKPSYSRPGPECRLWSCCEVSSSFWPRRPASPTTRIRIGMATIATITRTSRETMAIDKVLPPREGIEAAGFVLPGRPPYYSKGGFAMLDYRL
jgi:hypothetical protein